MLFSEKITRSGGSINLFQLRYPLSPLALPDEAPAMILFSSGTTGVPKGVVLSHGNVTFNSRSKRRYLRLRSEDRLLLFVPLFQVFGLNAILHAALHTGATVVLRQRFGPESVLQEVQDHAVTVFFAVPTVYALLSDRLDRSRVASVRLWFSAAATLPADLAERWNARTGQPLLEGYGLTETAPFACFNHLERHRTGSVGTPIDGVRIQIIDPDSGEKLDTDQAGEVCISGPNVMMGYWQDPEASAAALCGGWFRTGDYGYLDEDGYLFLSDRIKDMINVAGMKVWPAEVEGVLSEHPAVRLAAVFRRPDEHTGEKVACKVILRDASTTSAEELLAWCQQRLARYQLPAELTLVDSLPTSPSGKVLRRVLSEAP